MSYDNDNNNDLQLEDVEDYSADYPPTNSGDYPNSEANMAPATEDEGYTNEKSPRYRRAAVIALVRNNKWAVAVCGVVLIVLIGVLAGSVGKESSNNMNNGGNSLNNRNNNNDDSFGTGVPPVKFEASTVDQDILAVLKISLMNTYDRHNLDKTLLNESPGEDSPQRQAMIFLARDKGVNSMEHTEKLQRFFLACLFYSTNMVPSVHVEDPGAWKVADNWMSNAHSCDWMGVECNEDKVITAIFLERNRLSGKIPVDISIIANNIESLDFTDNIMHMRDGDFDAFTPLKNLKTLLMDDNYLFHDQGLPPQFKSLTSLEKLRLSYNIFEGDLDGGGGDDTVLGAMTKLTHLEMESNYFTGPFPTAITTMDKLTYCYLRRNNMAFNLDFLKVGQFNNMCKLYFLLFYLYLTDGNG